MGSGGLASVSVGVFLAKSVDKSVAANQVEGFSLLEIPTGQDGAAHSRGQVLGASKGLGRGRRLDSRINHSITMAVSTY